MGKNLAIAHEDVDSGLSKQMDMHNNNEGWKIYESNPNASLGELSDKVQQAVNNGQMLYLSNGQLIPTPAF